jgi:hypothetical protein
VLKPSLSLIVTAFFPKVGFVSILHKPDIYNIIMVLQFLFRWMAKYPWPFMTIWPAICCIFIGLAWGTIDDIVNDNVAQQWIPQRGAYATNLKYGKRVGTSNNGLGASTISAMAIARDDNNNLLTASRLEQIRARMERVEEIYVRITSHITLPHASTHTHTQHLPDSYHSHCGLFFLLLSNGVSASTNKQTNKISYNGTTYWWNDVCYHTAGFPYQMPCSRLSPLDFFQEAKWFFNESSRRLWYHEFIQKQLVRPRLPRFAILMQQCSSSMGGDGDAVVGTNTTTTSTACQAIVQKRIAKNQTFLLLKDAGGLVRTLLVLPVLFTCIWHFCLGMTYHLPVFEVLLLLLLLQW